MGVCSSSKAVSQDISAAQRKNLGKYADKNDGIVIRSGGSYKEDNMVQVIENKLPFRSVDTGDKAPRIAQRKSVERSIPVASKESEVQLRESEVQVFAQQWRNLSKSTANLSASDVASIINQWTIFGDKTPSAPVVVSNRKKWREVRLFISSTFTDYFAEREILVKQIVPKLREWCATRRLFLIDIDLRWGVPAASTTETILRACLGEIDRAKIANSNPFFLNMLGHRYGWVPSQTDIPKSVRDEYGWVDGASVTQMEILTGAFREYNQVHCAIFCSILLYFALFCSILLYFAQFCYIFINNLLFYIYLIIL